MHASAPPVLLSQWMAPFQSFFTRPTWHKLLVLIAGAILCPGRRTVTAALSVMGLRDIATFTNFHRVLNRDRWPKPGALARRLLVLLIAAFVPEGPVVIGLDETLERRWGAKIAARGIYRDPVRSSKGHFVKASGLRWVCAMLLVPIPWAGRVWALPFLTVLAPSERYAHQQGRRHKKLTDVGRQVLLQVARWLPQRALIAVADSTYAVIELLAAVRQRLTVITRLRLDARLFDPPAPRKPGRRGRPPLKGARQPTLAQRFADPTTAWHRVTVTGWDGRTERRLDIASGTAVWSHPGLPPVPIRWVLVRDAAGEFEPQALLCTDLDADPRDILRHFVRRWSMEVTFAEVRRHLGVESQRQWTDLAIARTTPALMGLFALITLWADALVHTHPGRPHGAAWYRKPTLTFSDAVRLVRHQLWCETFSETSRQIPDMPKSTANLVNRLLDLACNPA
jgi:DDE superfamily endonuclease